MSKRDYYDVIGVSKSATQLEIKRAFRKLAMKYHPDRNKEADAEDKFKEINEAYEILSDEEKRASYDQYGHDAFGQGQGQGGFGGFGGFGDFNDIFSSFFGGRRADPNAPRKGQDMQMGTTITFEESVFGKVIDQSLYKYVDGEKKSINIEIKVPAGISDGQQIRLSGYGNQGENGGENGDLFILVSVKSHKRWVRAGIDIIVDLDVSVFDVMAERILEIPTPHGMEVIKLKNTIQSGQVFTVKGKGFSSMGHGHDGNFLVRVNVFTPKMNEKERNAVVKVARTVKDKIYKNWRKGF